MDTFPIDAARQAFDRAMAAGDPVVVAAPTGSGKSTRLPEWLEASGARVLVVEPRRVACRALAGWVVRRRGEALGETVGYRVRFDDRSGPNTRILFATPGVALNMAADGGSGGLGAFDAVLVDEFHERSWEIELLVAIVRGLTRTAGGPRLVLCSATLDTDDLVDRLGATLVVAEGRSFPIHTGYAGDGPPSDRDLDQRVAAAVREALSTDDHGEVLVFLPGKGEIDTCRRALVDLEANGSVELVPVHARIAPDRFLTTGPSPGIRRVFLATNVAETSLTLPGVTVVIDSGLARMRIHRAGRNVLALVPISRASMDQRAGRAGRVAAGRCVRLWGRSFAPSETTPPEIQRTELDDLVLRAAQCGLQGETLPQAPWVAPPPGFALTRARERLRRLGALDAQDHLTDQGRIQASIPVSAYESRILIDVPSELAPAVADIVALLEVGRDLLLPGRVDDPVLDARRELLTGIDNEVFVQLACLRRGDARRHGLNRVALQEARRLANALRHAVGAPSLAAQEGLPVPAPLADFLLLRLPTAAFARRPRADSKRGRRQGPSVGEPWGNGEIELSIRPYAVPAVDPDTLPAPPRTAVVLDHTWIGTGQRARGVGRMLLPCTPEQIVAAGIGDTVVGDPKRRDGAIVATVEHRLAGAVLDSDERPLHGDDLRRAIASLILRGDLRRGLGARIQTARHVWHLIHQSTEPPASAPPDATAYLADTLERHGLERAADLALLDDEDLLPDLARLAVDAGLTPRELTALERDFPPTFAFEGRRYLCLVDLGRRLVTLEPDNREARAKNEPPVRVLPRFRGFRVAYRKASRVVNLR